MAEERVKRKADFTEGPILRKIIMFTLPLMATGLLQTLYNASDMIVVGNFSSVGSTAMGAVGACGALINLIINLFMGLSIGAGVMAAQSVGAKKYDDVLKIIHTSLIASIIGGIFVGLFGFFMAKPLLEVMGTPAEQLSEAVPYMKAYFVGMPGCLLYNYCASIMRSCGDTKRPLIFLTISGLCNVVLNLVMVICFGMGAIGVGIATSAAQYISAVMIVVYMLRSKGICRIVPREIMLHSDKLWTMIKIGLPAGIQGSLFSVSNVLIQSTVNTYGTIVVDGNAAAANIEGFIYIGMNSIYQAAVTFVGQNVGAGKIERLPKIIFVCSALVFAFGGAAGMLMFVLKEQLLSIYASGNEAVIAAGVKRIMVFGFTYYGCGLMDVGCGIMRGMGKSLLPMIVSLLGSCALRILWIYLVCPFFPGNITVLYISYPVSWILTGGVHFLSVFISYRAMKREHEMAYRSCEAVEIEA